MKNVLNYVPRVPSCLYFVRTFIFVCALRVFIVCVPYENFFFFFCLTCPSFFHILFMYMLIILTQINEHLSNVYEVFHFYKTRVIFCMIFSFFEKKKILITAEESTWPFQILEHYLKQKFRES